jgi:hypothetical protein
VLVVPPVSASAGRGGFQPSATPGAFPELARLPLGYSGSIVACAPSSAAGWGSVVEAAHGTRRISARLFCSS